MNEYQVKYRINAIIGITVNADSQEAAKERADKILKKSGTFDDGIEYMDGVEEYVGSDNLDLWDIRN